MKIAISTESTCDLSRELINKYEISIIPYTVILGDDIVQDNENVPGQIFNYVAKTGKLPQTSAINESDYENYFLELLEDYDAVVHITLSSEISSSYSHAAKVAEKMKSVYVIDSKSLSTGIGLLALFAKSLVDAGEDIESVVEKVRQRVPFVQASFVIERLDYLYKGGRCNALSLFGANLLKIRPQIVLEDGKMKPANRYRGKMEKCIESYARDTLEKFNNPDKTITALEGAGFENIYETTAGGTITSHCGEHVLGILYINDGGKV